jgi:hypothetical protein
LRPLEAVDEYWQLGDQRVVIAHRWRHLLESLVRIDRPAGRVLATLAGLFKFFINYATYRDC